VGGTISGQEVSASALLKSLTRDLDPAGTVKVAVGSYRDGLTSWDHAKIVSADGSEAIVGGHNMWTKHYLDKNPVHDVSMRVRGSAATHASHYADQIWGFTCKPSGVFSTSDVQSFPQGTNGCDAKFALSPSAGGGHAPVFAAGRLGAIGDESSDDAILAMVQAARTRVRLSLQDLGPPSAIGVPLGSWPEGYMSAIVGAIGRGADVFLVLSNKGAVPGGLHAGSATYSNGYTVEDALQKIFEHAQKHPELLGGDARAALCAKLHIAPLRAGPDDAWADGNVFANHAKLVMVDDRALYIGSQNWYAANLAEFGYIVDDVAAAKDLNAEYYDRLWEASRRAAVSGSDAPRCAL
jgi:phosphatidylserine/phosphatidylglycerophosphate/cardiolipin synthase-like enzyme